MFYQHFVINLISITPKDNLPVWSDSEIPVRLILLCTPGMGVNLWGEASTELSRSQVPYT